MTEQIAVIGAGAWGTALAKVLAENGNDVMIWAHETEVVEGINRDCHNHLFLPKHRLPTSLRATNDPLEALRGRKFVVSAVPSTHLRDVWTTFSSILDQQAIVVSCTKGIEIGTLMLMSQVLDDCLPDHPPGFRTVLSGPSFAHEVAEGKHTWVVVAGTDPRVCKQTQNIFTTPTFHPFYSSAYEFSVEGVEVGGAIKNVMAIATGISDGMEMGRNARAANITRGLYEMMIIGSVFGVDPVTFGGLAGIGDLMLTCTSTLSRNYTVGLALGQGKSSTDILKGMRVVAEGVPTADAVHRLAKKHSIGVPICEMVYRILHEGLSAQVAVERLCMIPLKEELGGLLELKDNSKAKF